MSLLITAETKEVAARLVAFAMRPENWYRYANGETPPGARGNTHRCILFPGIDAVFSWTVADSEGPHGIKPGSVVRHLSLQTTRSSGLPNPVDAFTLASWFGFTGGQAFEGADDIIDKPAPDWIIGKHETERSIVIAQKVPDEELPGTP